MTHIIRSIYINAFIKYFFYYKHGYYKLEEKFDLIIVNSKFIKIMLDDIKNM